MRAANLSCCCNSTRSLWHVNSYLSSIFYCDGVSLFLSNGEDWNMVRQKNHLELIKHTVYEAPVDSTEMLARALCGNRRKQMAQYTNKLTDLL
jgi:hypothetical protein